MYENHFVLTKHDPHKTHIKLLKHSSNDIVYREDHLSDLEKTREFLIEPEDDAIMHNNIHLHIRHNSIVRLHNLKISGNISITQEGNGILHMTNGTWRKSHASNSIRVFSKHIYITENTIDHAFHFNNTEGVIHIDNNKITGSNSGFHFERGDGEIYITNNHIYDHFRQDRETFMFDNTKKVIFNNNTLVDIEGSGDGSLISIHHPHHLSIQNNDIRRVGNMNTIFKIHDNSQNILIENNNLVISSMSSCNQSSQTLGLFIIIQYSNFTLDTLIVRHNTVIFNQTSGVAYFVPFFQYLPFYFQDTNFTNNLQNIYNTNPSYYNVSFSREQDLINGYAFSNTASISNILTIFNNTIYINRVNPFDNTAVMCQTSLFSSISALLVSNKITEKTDITQSFIWVHLIPTFAFSSITIDSNRIIVNAISTSPITYNPHIINYHLASSFVYIHGYTNTLSLNIIDNSIQTIGIMVLSGTSTNTLIRLNIKRGVFLTDNLDINEGAFINIFNLSAFIASKNKGTPSALRLPYQYIVSQLLSSNTQLLNFPYGMQIEPVSGDVYNGKDQCNYICSDVALCNACYLTDSINNPLLTEFSPTSNGLCFNKNLYSNVFNAGSGCRHNNLKISGPIVNSETVIFAVNNLYDYTLNVSPRYLYQSIVFRINNNMIVNQKYADVTSGGVINQFVTPYIISPINPVTGGALMDSLSFRNISFVIDNLVINQNTFVFNTLSRIPTVKSTLNNLVFDGCSFISVQSPFVSISYYSNTLININNTDVNAGYTTIERINNFQFTNNYVNGMKDIVSNDISNDNNDGILRNITMVANRFESIVNGLLNLEFGENIIFDDNVCVNCHPNQLTGVVTMISGFTSGVCYGYCSVQNNNITIYSQIYDTTQGTAVFVLDNINNPLIVKNNIDNTQLYYGILYKDILSFECNFNGMRLLKGLNFDIHGTIYDISCGRQVNVSCIGIGCLVDQSLIPDNCTVNQTVSINDPRYYFSQFPTLQIAIDNCKAANNRIIYLLPDVYVENSLVIRYNNYNGALNATLRLIGLMDLSGNKPVVIGNSHIITNGMIGLSLYIENIFFMNGNGVFSIYVGIDSFMFSMGIGATVDNIYIENSDFFGVVFYNNTIQTIPSTLSQFHNMVNQSYLALKGIINPALSNVNTDTLLSIRYSHQSKFANNRLVGSNRVALYMQFYTSHSVDWSAGRVTAVLDNNVGESNWGSFMQLIHQFNVNITNNVCVYFCGCYSQQTIFYELIKVSFWITTPLPPFVNTGGQPLYSLRLLRNEITASVGDVPVNNPFFPVDRIIAGFPFTSTNIITTAVSIISTATLTYLDFESFQIKNNTFDGLPAGLSLRALDTSIEIKLNEPFGNVPLYNDLVRYMREIQIHNANPTIRGLFVDIQSIYPVTTDIISPNLYCNGLCPPSFLSTYYCRINSVYSLLNNPTTFGVTDFNTIKDAFYYCPYNRALMTNTSHYENIDLSRLNYAQTLMRNIPSSLVFLLESGSSGTCTIYGFQHRIDQIDDFSSTNYITSIQFSNLIFKMMVTASSVMPLQSTPCFVNTDSNYRFSSIFYMHVSNPSAQLPLANLQFTFCSFIFEVGDSNNHQISILNRVLVCASQAATLMAFNCESCLVNNFLFNRLTFSSVDSLGQAYHTKNYSLNGISIRQPVSSFTTNQNQMTKIIISNIDVLSSISYSTRRFIELTNIQYYKLDTIVVPVCNPNPFVNSVNVTAQDNNACIFVSSVHYPSISVFFNQSLFAQPIVKGLLLGSVYTTPFSQATINPYKAPPTGPSLIPYSYVGFQWNVDAIIQTSPYNSFYVHAMIFNISDNTVTGSAASNIHVGIEIKGSNFTSIFSCTDFLTQVAPISNATLFGYLNTYFPKNVINILNNKNADARGTKFNSIIVDQEGVILKMLNNPNLPGSNMFSCFSCTIGCGVIDTVAVFNRVYLLAGGFLLFVFFVWLTFGLGCRWFMGANRMIEAYNDVRKMQYQDVREIRDLNNQLEIIKNSK